MTEYLTVGGVSESVSLVHNDGGPDETQMFLGGLCGRHFELGRHKMDVLDTKYTINLPIIS